MKPTRPIVFLISFLLLTGLACSFVRSLAPQAPEAPAGAAQQKPTTKPNLSPAFTSTAAPTSPPVATARPTDPPTPEAQQFFTDEFDTDNGWQYFVIDGNNSQITIETNPNMTVSIDGGLLAFDLQDENLWVYYLYQSFEYENVRLDTRVNNRGANNNNVSLICRYTDTGWYEFNIANNGLYWILVATVDQKQKVLYDLIYNGGSSKIKSGKETNEYAAICKGNELSLFINGEEARTVTDTRHGLSSGQVGVSVSSFDSLPITVDFEWVKISEP